MKINFILLIISLTLTTLAFPIQDFANNGYNIGEFNNVPMNYGVIKGPIKTGDNNLFSRNISDGEYADIEEDERTEPEEDLNKNYNKYDTSLKKRRFLKSHFIN
ncbi:hypothetical protein U3516DRAFT_665431 [Neocallimastix sp. 'constans']